MDLNGIDAVQNVLNLQHQRISESFGNSSCIREHDERVSSPVEPKTWPQLQRMNRRRRRGPLLSKLPKL